MPALETVTIVNKSGKVVSTGKHLVNIFKDAKEAYNEKKNALKADHYAEIKHKNAQKLLRAREETQSVVSSRHSRTSCREHRSRRHDGHRGEDGSSRPPLTQRNIDIFSEGSVASGRSGRSKRSHRSSSRNGGENRSPRSPVTYQAPYFENAEMSTPSLVRRNTDFPSPQSLNLNMPSQLSRTFTQPPPYTSQVASIVSPVPDLQRGEDEGIDMNLAYGPLPPELRRGSAAEPAQQQELVAAMSKLDILLLEAHCVQHSAAAIIANLQSNPEAMAAVALTLAELSNLLTQMGPGVLAALKGSSPAIFALLASPQFLIAGGVAIGVTVVMFGGFKIIKKIQANVAATKEANSMEEALFHEGAELGSIDTWRRGIAEAEAQSVSTSVDGEFITPEALRQNKERIRDRAREERIVEEGSVADSQRTVRRAGSVANSDATIRPKVPPRPSSSTVVSTRPPPLEGGKRRRSKMAHEGSVKGSSKGKGKQKEVFMIEEKENKSNALTLLFKKGKADRTKKRESEMSHRPKLIDI
ncbi:hypothetical protein BJ878DRAFT_188671 [Calycina marina]|uniref:Uncharacterized protein n=1 Tax=Calycina marina TaxID=1763456 RepID=A0A9P7YY32_9HELO|nr:hypothetical protein BJ878DRAFT_188671 [Calycina marina]